MENPIVWTNEKKIKLLMGISPVHEILIAQGILMYAHAVANMGQDVVDTMNKQHFINGAAWKQTGLEVYNKLSNQKEGINTIEHVEEIMFFSDQGALAQILVLESVNQYSKIVLSMNDEKINSVISLFPVSVEEYRAAAQEIDDILKKDFQV